MEFPDHPFWDFALRVYRAEGVGQACLGLQGRHGIDVNVMLFCLYTGHSGYGVLGDDEMAAALEASQSWHHTVVKGLRAVRQAMKTDFPHIPQNLCQTLRGSVQASEIDSEHLEQLVLIGSLNRQPMAPGALIDRAGDATASFRVYIDRLGLRFGPPDAVDFAHVLGQAFPGIEARQSLDYAESLL